MWQAKDLNLLNTEDQGVLSAVVMVRIHSQEKILKVWCRATRMGSKCRIHTEGSGLGALIYEIKNIFSESPSHSVWLETE